MIQIVIWIVVSLSAFNLVLLIIVLKRLAFMEKDEAEHTGQDELRSLREEVSRAEREVKEEVRVSQRTTTDTLVRNIGEFSQILTTQVERMRTTVEERFQSLQQSSETRLDQIRQTVTNQLQSTTDTLVGTVGELGEAQTRQLESVTKSINGLTQANETRIENVRKTVDARLQAMQASNESKLDQIRQTVNEQLQGTADTLVRTVGELGEAQKTATDTLVGNIGEFSQILTTQVERMRTTVEERFQSLQQSSETRLDQIRQTVTNQLQSTTDTLVGTVGELGEAQTRQLESVTKSINGLTQANETRIENVRKTVDARLQAMQASNENKLNQISQTVNEQLQGTADTLVRTVGELGEGQTRQLTSGTKAINDLTQSNETSIENVRKTVDERLQAMQASNENKLDQVRKTVDEQLQSTLEKRLGESFNIVSKRLEDVQRGLGEMQNLATGVGDLKRVLTNVKARGTWGEVQLGALLEDVLTPDQYSKNVQVRENSRERVEYAIRLPGSNDGPDSCVWLPIDSKFPLADYERLVDAADVSDASAVQEATQAFIRAVQAEAKKIRDKYIAPPKTTDFAIMFLPTEGLYAEVLRSPGRVTELLQRYRIVVAGPTTLAAILSSLRMGFRTLAIEKRSSEVWEVLAAVKTEFGKFGDVMNKLRNQLNRASKTIDETGVRTRAMERELRTVEELPLEEATARLGLLDGEHAINGDNADD